MMKYLLILFSMFSFSLFWGQKTKKIFAEKEFFHSGFDGGSGDLSFRIIQDEKEFLTILNEYNTILTTELADKNQYPAFPKDKKVILYNLGSFRSGDHQPKKIEKIIVNKGVMVVYLPKNNSKKAEMQIQVISNPWMIFSVPKDVQFTHILVQ